jgi:hypothetical protein
MGTQGLVTLLDDKGGVGMKIVAGCNGQSAGQVAARCMMLGRIPSVPEALQIAQEANYGCPGCIAVVTPDRIVLGGEDADPEGPWTSLYRATFGDPKFNPRWARGTADHSVVLCFDIDKVLDYNKLLGSPE